jgi:hypothetical protein
MYCLAVLLVKTVVPAALVIVLTRMCDRDEPTCAPWDSYYALCTHAMNAGAQIGIQPPPRSLWPTVVRSQSAQRRMLLHCLSHLSHSFRDNVQIFYDRGLQRTRGGPCACPTFVAPCDHVIPARRPTLMLHAAVRTADHRAASFSLTCTGECDACRPLHQYTF